MANNLKIAAQKALENTETFVIAVEAIPERLVKDTTESLNITEHIGVDRYYDGQGDDMLGMCVDFISNRYIAMTK